MDIVNVGTVGHCDHNVSNEYKALYAEIQTLRAKVASAEVLVEALTMLLTTREYKEVNGKDYVYDAMRITAWGMAEKALATYDKLSEVNHDTK